MFVRFKQKQTKAGQVFNVSIQESFRDPSELGRVKSRTIAGLGSVPVKPHPTEAAQYWFKLDAKLDALPLSPDNKAKIRGSIQDRIPRPEIPLPQLVRNLI